MSTGLWIQLAAVAQYREGGGRGVGAGKGGAAGGGGDEIVTRLFTCTYVYPN